jgi:hypothetical protein
MEREEVQITGASSFSSNVGMEREKVQIATGASSFISNVGIGGRRFRLQQEPLVLLPM